MEKLQFKVSINAPVPKIYDSMLGTTSKSTYEQWTSLFNPTSTYEGSWDKGSKILFIGVVEKWANGFENYTFEEANGTAIVTVDLDTTNGFLDYMNQTYPKALEKLREICEEPELS